MGVHHKWQSKITANLSFSPHHVQANHLTCVTQLFYITHMSGSEELSNFSKVIELESSKGRELSKLMPAMQTRSPSRRGLLWMSCGTWERVLCWVKCCSVAKLCPTLWNSMNCSSPGFPVLHYLPQFAQTHLLKLIVHWDSDATQPSHHLLPPFPPALNLSQHQGLFQWVSSFHEVAKVLQLQLQHQ